MGVSGGSGAVVPATAVFTAQQQVRGMKVRSAIKKRCEHCKVSGRLLEWGGWRGLLKGGNMWGIRS